MSLSILKLIIAILPTVIVLSSVIIIGIKIEKFRSSHVVVTQCNERYTKLYNKTTFTSLLLMEITTEEQQDKARKKMESFELSKKESL